ncbi:MAG: threonine-phosphate decarboxylase [Thermosediminibacterales bacterium]|nr:threonine-phosphate decarboxylase [Thermosediminibacterales bacterium]MDK2835789.1 threonine-phosphate decarboxylase [Thermosediminibacterales bacterium]
MHGGNIETAAREYGLKVDSIIDFSANINPLGPSPRAVEAIKQNLDKIVHYPDIEYRELQQELARHLSVKPELIIPGNGASELIYLIANRKRPGCALMPAPTFSEYEMAVKGAGGKVKFIALSSNNNFNIELNEFENNLSDIDMVFLCNPNNPTGTILERDRLLEFVDKAGDKGIFVVIDEAFMDFVEDEDKRTLRNDVEQRNNLFVLGSLTKFFALPGLRIGYGIGPSCLINQLRQYKEPWSINIFAQAAALASLRDTEYIRKTRNYIYNEKMFLFNALNELPGFKAYPSASNYFFIDIRGSGFTAAQLQSRLGPKGILIRNCSSYPFLDDYYIRVAVRTREENLFLINVLKNILEGRSNDVKNYSR